MRKESEHWDRVWRIVPEKLTEPLKWKKPARIFVDSMSDLFHEGFDFNYIAACFSVMALASQHTFQILTKRPERAARFFEWVTASGVALGMDDANVFHHFTIQGRNNDETWESAVRRVEDTNASPLPLPNVHIGTSIATQADADKNIPHLLQIPAAVRFLSIEPLIEGVILPPEALGGYPESDEWARSGPHHPRVDWVIVGGESGPGARPCNVEWIRSVVAQCKEAGVPCFVKQLGTNIVDRNDAGFEGDEPDSWPMDTRHESLTPEGWQGDPVRVRLSKKGGDWNEWPADLRVRQMPEVTA